MKTLNNKQFIQLLHECCSDHHVDDQKLQNILCTYFPYNLVFKGNLKEKEGDVENE